MKNYFVLIASLLLFVASLFAGNIFSSIAQADEKTNPHYEWISNTGEWSDCVLTESGYIQTRTTTFTCGSKQGNAVSECSPTDVKASEIETKDCASKLAYCHANSGTKEYNYHFNSAWVAHFENNGSPQAGHELDFFTWEGNTQCLKDEVEKTPVCADDSYDNYGGADGRFDSETETEDNSLCENNPEDPQDPTPLSCPEGQHLDAGKVNCVSFSDPGPGDSGTGGPAGQVLGTSTMAATGGAMDAIFYSMFTFGSLLTSFGIMKNGKKKI